MSQAINVGWLLPMYATRQMSNESWDFWIDNLVEKAKATEKHPFEMIGEHSNSIFFDNRYSSAEKCYVSERLSKLSEYLRNEEIENGNYKEFLDGIERLLDAVDILDTTRETVIQEEIENLKELNDKTQSVILGMMRDRYSWFDFSSYVASPNL